MSFSAKIAVAIPTHEMVPATFMYDFASMCSYTVAALPDDVEFGIQMVQATLVHAARADLMQTLLRDGATHILWLDSDMRFPRNMLVRLLQHNKPAVGVNYAKRGIPTGYVALKKVGLDKAGEHLKTLDSSTGLEEVEAVGFGCFFLKTSSLNNMPDPKEKPWFEHVYLGDGHWMGEDVRFCELYRESGQKILVDHDLSKECAHVGQFEYRLEHVEAQETE